MQTQHLFRPIALFVLWPFLLACPFTTGDDNSTKTSAATLVLLNSHSGNATCTVSTFTLAGNWTDNYGGSEAVTINGATGTWIDFIGTRTILEHDGSTGILYYSFPKPASDPYNIYTQCTTNCYGRIEWIPVPCSSNRMYFCESAYNLGSLATAKSAGGLADRSAAPTGGCGGFSWTIATK